MTSDTPPNKLYPALLNALQAMGPVLKNATNPAFRTKYADLSAVIDAIEAPLWENGLLLVQRFTQDGDQGPILVTDLVHAESGERISSAVRVVSKDPTDPQKMGGAITYYRRYSLLALLGLAPEDDDGNSASKPAPPHQQPAQRPAEQQPAASANGSGKLDTDQVLAILGEMDDSREPWHEIKRYADDQSVTREGDDVLRIHDKLRAIASRRKAAAPAPQPAPVG